MTSENTEPSTKVTDKISETKIIKVVQTVEPQTTSRKRNF